ncbi:MAG TPA: alpha/beta fold hydrolase [Dehalococcoidia bacterium]|nr:alpha/beta fold hydrolase [Dehalococcoidia bacterium]
MVQAVGLPPPDAVHADRWGSGERVVLVHGTNAPDPSRFWSRQRPLAARWQLVVLHRRGYGESTAPAVAEPAVHVADIIALLGDGAHLVGHSYGGTLALLVAAQAPELLHSLTLIEPAAMTIARGHAAVEHAITRLQRLYAAQTPEALFQAMLEEFGLPPRDDLVLSPTQRRALASTMLEPRPWTVATPIEALVRIAFPVLLMTGGWAPGFDAIAEVIQTRLRVEHAVIAGRGHDVQATGEPFNQRLAAFLTQAEAKQSDGL